MRFDRVAEDIFILISEQYAQVTATVLLTSEGAIVVDTLPFPSESRQLVAFIESHLGARRIRYVVNTHHHADHVYGNYLCEGAQIVAHDKCYDLLQVFGPRGLEIAKRDTPELAEVELRYPQLTFQRQMHLHVGHRHLRLIYTPGHTVDCISAFVVDEKVLIAGDTVMPVPYVVRGNPQQLIESLQLVKSLRPNFVIQGHGEVLLRGELDENIDSSIAYLNLLVERVRAAVQDNLPLQELRKMDIESFGKSRIPLDGLVNQLHANNLVSLYRELSKGRTPPGEMQ